MTTIRDVAERAGVSATTVSHVLNRTRRVDAGTVARVTRAIDELGYRPNAVARSMRHGQTYTIGVVIPDVSNPFFADLARAIEDLTFAGGYSAIFCNSDGDEGKEGRYLDMLLSKQVDGLLLISAGQSSERLRRVVETGPPMVIVDRELDDLGVSQVMVDNHEGGRLAGRYLVGLGHRRIGVIVGPDILRPSARRLDGFRAELAVVGADLSDDLITRGSFRSREGRTAMRSLLRLPERPTAVFAENDLMAFGAMGAIHDAGLRIPDDISIMGFDDVAFSELSTPGLTTVSQPLPQVAATAMRLLFERLRDRTLPPTRVVLPVSLVERSSCRVL